jgi:hypothetical protein
MVSERLFYANEFNIIPSIASAISPKKSDNAGETSNKTYLSYITAATSIKLNTRIEIAIHTTQSIQFVLASEVSLSYSFRRIVILNLSLLVRFLSPSNHIHEYHL